MDPGRESKRLWEDDALDVVLLAVAVILLTVLFAFF